MAAARRLSNFIVGLISLEIIMMPQYFKLDGDKFAEVSFS